MGFLKSTKGSIISDMFQLMEQHGHMQPGWMYDVALYDDHLQITQKVGGKAEATLGYNQITDIFYGLQTEAIEKKQSAIGRAVVGGALFGGAGAVVGAMTAGKKEKLKPKMCFIISYLSSSGEERFLAFEDTRMYKGKKVARTLMDICGLADNGPVAL